MKSKEISVLECIDGERFTAASPTPLLAGCISATERGLREALTAAYSETVVESFQQWSFADATQLTPTIVAWRGRAGARVAPAVPELVVEFRTESTARYILGPKRMVYSRYRVPELWFVDLTRQRVAVLTTKEGGHYGWPPVIVRPAAVLTPAGFPGAQVDTDVLLRSWPAERVREPASDEDWCEI